MITIRESTTKMKKLSFTPGTPGDRLMSVISELGFTNQGDFAEKLYEPISQPTVSRWVNRQDKFSKTIMFALSGYLIERGINPDWLNDPAQPKYIRDMVDDSPTSSDLQMDIIRLKQQREADIERLRDKFDEERRELQEKIHQMQAEIIQAYKEIAKYSKLILNQQQGRDPEDDSLNK